MSGSLTDQTLALIGINHAVEKLVKQLDTMALSVGRVNHVLNDVADLGAKIQHRSWLLETLMGHSGHGGGVKGPYERFSGGPRGGSFDDDDDDDDGGGGVNYDGDSYGSGDGGGGGNQDSYPPPPPPHRPPPTPRYMGFPDRYRENVEAGYVPHSRLTPGDDAYLRMVEATRFATPDVKPSLVEEGYVNPAGMSPIEAAYAAMRGGAAGRQTEATVSGVDAAVHKIVSLVESGASAIEQVVASSKASLSDDSNKYAKYDDDDEYLKGALGDEVSEKSQRAYERHLAGHKQPGPRGARKAVEQAVANSGAPAFGGLLGYKGSPGQRAWNKRFAAQAKPGGADAVEFGGLLGYSGSSAQSIGVCSYCELPIPEEELDGGMCGDCIIAQEHKNARRDAKAAAVIVATNAAHSSSPTLAGSPELDYKSLSETVGDNLAGDPIIPAALAVAKAAASSGTPVMRTKVKTPKLGGENHSQTMVALPGSGGGGGSGSGKGGPRKGPEDKEAKELAKQFNLLHETSKLLNEAFHGMTKKTLLYTSTAMEAASPDAMSTLSGSFKLLFAQVGTELIGPTAMLSQKLQEAAKGFNSLPPALKKTVGGLLAGAAALSGMALFAKASGLSYVGGKLMEGQSFGRVAAIGAGGTAAVVAAQVAKSFVEYKSDIHYEGLDAINARKRNIFPSEASMLADPIHRAWSAKAALRPEGWKGEMQEEMEAKRRKVSRLLQETAEMEGSAHDTRFNRGIGGAFAGKSTIWDITRGMINRTFNSEELLGKHAELKTTQEELTKLTQTNKYLSTPPGERKFLTLAEQKSKQDSAIMQAHGLLLDVQSRTQPSYNSVEDIYKKIQLEALAESPLQQEIRQIQLQNLEKLVEACEYLKAMSVRDGWNAIFSK